MWFWFIFILIKSSFLLFHCLWISIKRENDTDTHTKITVHWKWGIKKERGEKKIEIRGKKGKDTYAQEAETKVKKLYIKEKWEKNRKIEKLKNWKIEKLKKRKIEKVEKRNAMKEIFSKEHSSPPVAEGSNNSAFGFDE